MDVSNFQSQFPYLLVLAILTTAIGHSLMVHSLKFFSTTTATIISSIQPVFGIVIAFFIVNEVPEINTIWGGLLIISTVLIETLRIKKRSLIIWLIHLDNFVLQTLKLFLKYHPYFDIP